MEPKVEINLPWPVCCLSDFLSSPEVLPEVTQNCLLHCPTCSVGLTAVIWQKLTQNISNNKLNKIKQVPTIKEAWILWAKPITIYWLFTFLKKLTTYSTDVFWWQHFGQQPSKDKHRELLLTGKAQEIEEGKKKAHIHIENPKDFTSRSGNGKSI